MVTREDLEMLAARTTASLSSPLNTNWPTASRLGSAASTRTQDTVRPAAPATVQWRRARAPGETAREEVERLARMVARCGGSSGGSR